MNDSTWIFERSEQRLTIVRLASPDGDGIRLTITVDDSSQSYPFRDLAAAVQFQTDMESFLIQSGWSFIKFSPECRTGRDRRTFPRLSERRRWWTDGMTILKQKVRRK